MDYSWWLGGLDFEYAVCLETIVQYVNSRISFYLVSQGEPTNTDNRFYIMKHKFLC